MKALKKNVKVLLIYDLSKPVIRSAQVFFFFFPKKFARSARRWQFYDLGPLFLFLWKHVGNMSCLPTYNVYRCRHRISGMVVLSPALCTLSNIDFIGETRLKLSIYRAIRKRIWNKSIFSTTEMPQLQLHSQQFFCELKKCNAYNTVKLVQFIHEWQNFCCCNFFWC